MSQTFATEPAVSLGGSQWRPQGYTSHGILRIQDGCGGQAMDPDLPCESPSRGDSVKANKGIISQGCKGVSGCIG